MKKLYSIYPIHNFVIKTFFWLTLFVVIQSTNVYGQEETNKKVLFVGNSYTYFWNLPQQVSAIANSQNIALETAQSTGGGTNWGQHWRGEKDLQTVELIKSGIYDTVVLQNHSMRSITAPDSLILFGQKFAELIKNHDAKVYLYMTWAREWDPYMQKDISDAYLQLAEKTDAVVVPVGLAWERAKELRPDIELYADDGSHPSPTGSYLTACVFYKVLTGESLKSLPARLQFLDIHGEKLYLNIQTEENALFLQKVAEEVVATFTDSQDSK